MNVENFNRPYPLRGNFEGEIEVKYKLNLAYKLLYIVLWPVYLFEWLATLGDSDNIIESSLWNSGLWYYRIMRWHQGLHQWGEPVDEGEVVKWYHFWKQESGMVGGVIAGLVILAIVAGIVKAWSFL